MKLLQLSCDKSSFHTLRFNPEGITLVIGDSASDTRIDGNSNGAGKTLALCLVHHCLGAQPEQRLKAAVPTWFFTLDFSINGCTHSVSRSGDGTKIFLDDEPIKLKQYRDWLNQLGVFVEAAGDFSFRSLIKRFARYERDDCNDPLSLKKETPYASLVRNLYLLGLDYELAISKKDNKLELDGIRQSLKNWQQDELLQSVFRAGTQPKLRADWLDKEIPRLEADLAAFQVAEDYRYLELEAGELTKKLRSLEKKISIVNFQIESIDTSMSESPDITKDDLLELYEGLQSIFKPEALAHFNAVEEFHSSLAINRKARLQKEKIKLKSQLQSLQQQVTDTSLARDQKLQSLQGKRALDEYSALTGELAELKAERVKLKDFIELTSKLQQKAQKIREVMVEEDGRSSQYVESNPEADLDQLFIKISEQLYPRTAAGILLENNIGENQVRYDLSVQIEGDDSDGINAAKVLCFDWLLLTHGANHTVDFLWHDNRLFADIDPKPRSEWFRFILKSIYGTGKQYIATINTENYEAMKEHLERENISILENSIVERLCGDKPENKLLGIQFGKAPK